MKNNKIIATMLLSTSLLVTMGGKVKAEQVDNKNNNKGTEDKALHKEANIKPTEEVEFKLDNPIQELVQNVSGEDEVQKAERIVKEYTYKPKVPIATTVTKEKRTSFIANLDNMYAKAKQYLETPYLDKYYVEGERQQQLNALDAEYNRVRAAMMTPDAEYAVFEKGYAEAIIGFNEITTDYVANKLYKKDVIEQGFLYQQELVNNLKTKGIYTEDQIKGIEALIQFERQTILSKEFTFDSEFGLTEKPFYEATKALEENVRNNNVDSYAVIYQKENNTKEKIDSLLNEFKAKATEHVANIDKDIEVRKTEAKEVITNNKTRALDSLEVNDNYQLAEEKQKENIKATIEKETEESIKTVDGIKDLSTLVTLIDYNTYRMTELGNAIPNRVTKNMESIKKYLEERVMYLGNYYANIALTDDRYTLEESIKIVRERSALVNYITSINSDKYFNLEKAIVEMEDNISYVERLISSVTLKENTLNIIKGQVAVLHNYVNALELSKPIPEFDDRINAIEDKYVTNTQIFSLLTEKEVKDYYKAFKEELYLIKKLPTVQVIGLDYIEDLMTDAKRTKDHIRNNYYGEDLYIKNSSLTRYKITYDDYVRLTKEVDEIRDAAIEVVMNAKASEEGMYDKEANLSYYYFVRNEIKKIEDLAFETSFITKEWSGEEADKLIELAIEGYQETILKDESRTKEDKQEAEAKLVAILTRIHEEPQFYNNSWSKVLDLTDKHTKFKNGGRTTIYPDKLSFYLKKDYSKNYYLKEHAQPDIDQFEREIREVINEEGSILTDKVKAKYKTNISNYGREAKSKIDKNENLSRTEKLEFKKEIDEEVKFAQDSVGVAESTEEVKQIEATAKVEIDKIVAKESTAMTPEVKDKFTNELDIKAKETETKIKDNITLTRNEKVKALNDLTKLLGDAKAQIEDAETRQDLDKIVRDTNRGMDNLATLLGTAMDAASKSKIKQELEVLAKDNLAKVNNNETLTSKEKAKVVNDINALLISALNDIDNSDIENEVNSIKNITKSGLNQLGNTDGTAATKEYKEEQIKKVEEQRVAFKEKAVKNTTLDAKELVDVQASIDNIAERALEALEKEESKSDVDNILINAKVDMNNAVFTIGSIASKEYKDDMNKRIDMEILKTLQEIKENLTMTNKEQGEAATETNEVGNKAKVDISYMEETQAAEEEFVQTKARFMSISSRMGTATTDEHKDELVYVMTDLVNTGKETVENSEKYTTDEKQTVKDELDTVLEQFKEELKPLDSMIEVDELFDTYSAKVDNILKTEGTAATLQDRIEAKKLIEEAETKAKTDLEVMLSKGLDLGSFNKGKEDVKTIASQGYEQVDTFEAKPFVDYAVQDTITKIEEIVENIKLEALRVDLSKTLDKEVDKLISEINEDKNLTDETKETLIKELEAKAKEIKDKIATTTNKDEITGLINDLVDKTKGNLETTTGNTINQVRKETIETIKANVDRVINNVKNNDTLTNKEKETALQELETIKEKAVKELETLGSVKDIYDLNSKTNEKIDKYNNIKGTQKEKELQQAKDKVIEIVKEETIKAIEQLKNNDTLTKTELETAINKVNELEKETKGNLDTNTFENVQDIEKVGFDFKTALDKLVTIEGTSKDKDLETALKEAEVTIKGNTETALNELVNNLTLTDKERKEVETTIKEAETKVIDKLQSGVLTNVEQVKNLVNEYNKELEVLTNKQGTQDTIKATKDKAKQLVVDNATKAIKELDNNKTLTSNEKKDLVSQINTKEKEALNTLNTTEFKEVSTINELMNTYNKELYKLVNTEGTQLKEDIKVAIKLAKEQIKENTSKAKEVLSGNKTLTDKERLDIEAKLDKEEKTTLDTINTRDFKELKDVEAFVNTYNSKLERLINVEGSKNKEEIDKAKQIALDFVKTTSEEARGLVKTNETLTETELNQVITNINKLEKEITNKLNRTTFNKVTEVQDLTEDFTDRLEYVVNISGTKQEKELQATKQQAKLDIDTKKNSIVQQILNSTKMTNSEKKQGIELVDTIVNNALKTLKLVDNQSGVLSLVTTTNTNLDNLFKQIEEAGTEGKEKPVDPGKDNEETGINLEEARTEANNKFNRIKEQVVNSLEANTTLTSQEKQDLNNELTKLLEDASKQISDAKNVDTMNVILDNLVNNSNKVITYQGSQHLVLINEIKKLSTNKVVDLTNNAKDNINNNETLTNEERLELDTLLTKTTKEALEAIGQAGDVDSINNILKQTEQVMNEILKTRGTKPVEPVKPVDPIEPGTKPKPIEPGEPVKKPEPKPEQPTIIIPPVKYEPSTGVTGNNQPNIVLPPTQTPNTASNVSVSPSPINFATTSPSSPGPTSLKLDKLDLSQLNKETKEKDSKSKDKNSKSSKVKEVNGKAGDVNKVEGNLETYNADAEDAGIMVTETNNNNNTKEKSLSKKETVALVATGTVVSGLGSTIFYRRKPM